MQKVLAKIDLKHIRKNASAWKSLCGVPITAVVKADAYGHGAEQVVCALNDVADAFAVSLLDEAKAVRVAACGKDILILTPPVNRQEIAECIWNGFSFTVPDLSTAKWAAEIAAQQRLPARVHLKTNTGMNRYGMHLSMLGKVCKFLRGQPNVRVDGMYSHLYGHTLAQAQEQRVRFLQMQSVCKRYFPDAKCHLSATYGALLGKAFAFDGVRIGLGLYGYIPADSQDIDERTLSALNLRKGMTVWTTAVCSRRYSHGENGYYPSSVRVEKGESISVLRAGYADGITRSDTALGSVCMDACIVTGRQRRGKQVAVFIDADETAMRNHTISYETLCNATRRAERVYVYE